MKKITIFIEGLEHFRFIEPYIQLFNEDKFELNIISLSSLGDKYSNYNLIDKKNLSAVLINLESDIFITTTPGIGNYYFPKSKVGNKASRPVYVYIFHSLVSPNQMYIKNSFAGFDYIFSPNQIISKQLNYLINPRKTKVIETGYPLLTNKYYYEKLSKDKFNILIAPSWGKNGLLHNIDVLKSLINSIDSQTHKIYLRPHPMEINKVKELKLGKHVYIDMKKDLNNLFSFDYLITDWSGIGIEYSLIKNKKAIYIETPKKKRRKLSNNEKKETLIEDVFRKKYGFILSSENIEEVETSFNTKKNWTIKNDSFITSMKSPIFNPKDIKKFLLTVGI